MSQEFNQIFKRFKQFVNIGTVVTVALLISLLYPNNVKFKYEFHRGQGWPYADLTAPFDFAINKSKNEMENDRALIMNEFWPYYTLNDNLENAKIKDFEAALGAWWKEASSIHSPNLQLETTGKEGSTILKKIYAKGILQLSPEHADADGNFVINVVHGNAFSQRTRSGFYLPKEAEAALESSFSNARTELPIDILPLLRAALVPNITYDEARTQTMLHNALSAVSPTKGLVNHGDIIIKKGNLVTDDVYEKLVSFRAKYESDISSKKSALTVYLGYLLLTGLILGAFLMYVNTYRKEILASWNYLAFVMVWLLGFSYLTYLVEQMEVLSIYVIPYCVVPVVVRHFFTYRLAFFTHVVVVLIAGFLTAEGHQFLFTQIVAGVVAVLAVADARDWTKFFKSVVAILVAYSLSHLGMSLIEEGSFRGIDWPILGWLAFNGFLTLLAFPLIPLAERVFGFTSAISLVELSDMNRPLLRDLAMRAPGTFQHSLQVGNLAEAAANDIGADALLVRVGALYHDIGKMKNPEYFVENQSGSSPHDGVNRLESARIIIEHVPEGEKLAKKYGLPTVITRFITTHHGTTKVEYFYKNYVHENPDIEVDKVLFTYPGPLPNSKEEAVLMLADSVEATSRSLKDPTGEDIDKLVDKIFKGKVDMGQLHESKLTFGDMEKCRVVFCKMLRSIYHIRMEYPE
ncbi:MAG: HDIG domain-containing protein [Saprospiraceae bacterium]|nr:HDIG domain-containing protein [Saprospiraceae bacterium]MCF8248846.1 HDIG domain-containing protein [Saprospiraceae bacterium]MCF8279571.1 HDIG domain-containing protein [Bacteroidales bacterium]MCF8310131.1 HDIG domain-containing protein [Saprospiraceae bacterium]MCF8439031.1 HDIG domain-containing protein [Saprospiraceae bacterium]